MVAREISVLYFWAEWCFWVDISKMLPPPGRRIKTSNGAGKSTAVEDFARHSVEADQDAAAAAGKEEDKEQQRGKIHCGGGFRSLLSGRRPRCRRRREGGGQEGTPLPGRGQEVAVRENTLRWRISPRYSVDCRRGGQGVAERQNPLRRGMSLGYSERSRKIHSIRGFRCLSANICTCLNFECGEARACVFLWQRNE